MIKTLRKVITRKSSYYNNNFKERTEGLKVFNCEQRFEFYEYIKFQQTTLSNYIAAK